MSDLALLLNALETTRLAGLEAVMATVVKVEGSAYRRPGARMVVPQLGGAVGTVSGGCLESDVTRKAWWLTMSGKPVIRSYTTGEDDDELEDAELSFGLGCNGTVHILFERLQPDSTSLVLTLLKQVQSTGRPAAIATVIFSDSDVAVGERVAIDSNGHVHTTTRQPALSTELESDLHQVLQLRASTTRRYMHDDGCSLEVLLEYLPAPRRLVIFGAGHDAAPLVSIAKLQGWHVSVVDARSHFARPERFVHADEVIVAPLDQPFSLKEQVNDALVVIMSHSYSQDRHWLDNVLHCAPLYIGQLGPRSRTERLLAEMDASIMTRPAFQTLHYPVGLDIGGDTPESVALSISSEMNAFLNRRQGGMLKHRVLSIHTSEPLQASSLTTRHLRSA
ncbi:MAG: xanthine dehydrogenase accessory factor [Pseudomonas sp.]|nr:xanthine dehydrogenase accessory factor [Pseudomonas sp.]